MTQHRRDISHWPDLQFHFGLSYTELRAMPNGIRRIYEEALPRLLADTQARGIDVVSFPHMKPDGQRKILRRIERAQKQGQREKVEVITDGKQFTDAVLTHGIAITAVNSKGEVIENVGARPSA